METREINIQSLMKRKRLSGNEAGRALIAGVFEDFKNGGNKPVDQETINALEIRIQSVKQKEQYNFYGTAYTQLYKLFDAAVQMNKEFMLGYEKIVSHLNLCAHAEDYLRGIHNGTPLLLTEAEYRRYRAKAKAARSARKESVESLLLAEVIRRLKPPYSDYIGDLIADTMLEPATNQRILSTYNQFCDDGCYLFEGDTLEEWKDHRLHKGEPNYHYAPSSPEAASKRAYDRNEQQRQKLERAFKDAADTVNRLYFGGKAALKKFYAEATGEKMKPEAEAAYMAVLEAMADPDKHEIKDEHEYFPYYVKLQGLIAGIPVTYQYFTEPPSLTKFDLLMDCDKFYTGFLPEFAADYPTVYAAILTALTDALPPLKDIEPPQYSEKVITWGKLAKLHFPGYDEERLEPTDNDVIAAFETNKKAQYRPGRDGIAVLHDKEEIVEPTDVQPLLSLKKIKKHDDNLESRYEDPLTIEAELHISRTGLLEPALRYYAAFNAFCDIFAKRYKIPKDFPAFSTTPHENYLEEMNNKIYALYADVFGTDAEKTQKRRFINVLFEPLKIDNYVASRSNIAIAKARFEALDECFLRDLRLRDMGSRHLLREFQAIFDTLNK